ncbi:MAG: type VI secretion system baseplate subunit TssE [Deltaproteobacteria bacterium]|jgi:type VI secretion system protein|nr:type VI secretion system baseplate subunit TssE [Deltaproteobacteria bacterium]
MRLRLLERLRAVERGEARSGNEMEALTASLEKHLVFILNTHQGTSQSAPDFGMPDFVSIMGNSDLDNIRELTQIITDVIEKYEPRIGNVEVGFNQSTKDTGVLDFTLNCSMIVNGVRRDLFFNTLITPDGSVRVRK